MSLREQSIVYRCNEDNKVLKITVAKNGYNNDSYYYFNETNNNYITRYYKGEYKDINTDNKIEYIINLVKNLRNNDFNVIINKGDR